MGRIGREFFLRYTPLVARDLVGCRLVRVLNGKRISGMIVETEAYRGAKDPASHAYRGRTPRNGVMFGPAGHAYVYFTMGMHHCLNVTTDPEGKPAAVLIRAAEPREGLGQMVKNRGTAEPLRLASGPGNLTRAFAIDKRLNGEDMVFSDRLYLESGEKMEVYRTSRVGVRGGEAFNWRFCAAGSPFISRAKPSKKHRTHN